MVGLRKQNFPTKEEDAFLFSYIRKNYGHRGIDEIVTAFDFAIKGFYDFDVKVYDQFTIAYLVSIMEGYRKYLINLIKNKIEEKEPMMLPVPELTDEERKEEIEYWRTSESKIYPLYLFDYLLKFKMIEWNDTIRQQYIDKAISIRQEKLKGSGNIDGLRDLRSLNQMIKEGVLQGSEKNQVIAIAKRLVINNYYR